MGIFQKINLPLSLEYVTLTCSYTFIGAVEVLPMEFTVNWDAWRLMAARAEDFLIARVGIYVNRKGNARLAKES